MSMPMPCIKGASSGYSQGNAQQWLALTHPTS
jgi:hypothetical protein